MIFMCKICYNHFINNNKGDISMAINMKQIISDQFLTIAKSKSIDTITVTDLANACNISRQAFYYHFQDIYAVMEWTLQREMEKGFQQSLETDNPEDAIRLFLNTSIQYKSFIEKQISSNKYGNLPKLFFETLRTYFIQLIERKSDEHFIYGETIKEINDINLIADFCTGGIFAWFLNNINNSNWDIDDMTHKIYTNIFQKLI